MKLIHKEQGKAVFLFILMAVVGLLCGCGSQNSNEKDVWGRADAKEIDINSKVAGRVTQLLVKEGDGVRKGQVLAYIDRRDLETQKAQAEANIQSLRAAYAQASVTTKMTGSTTASSADTAQAALESAASVLKLSETDYERYQTLVGQGAVSQQSFDTCKSKYEVAQTSYAAAEADLAKAKAGLLQTDVSMAAEASAQKQIELAEAKLQEIEVALDETVIRAPFDGVITEKYIEEGFMISTGTPLVAVQDPTDNWVDFKIPETELTGYKLHQRVTLAARDGKTKVEGEITDISKKSEFATTRATSERGDETDIISFNVKVQVDSDVIRPGMRFRFLK